MTKCTQLELKQVEILNRLGSLPKGILLFFFLLFLPIFACSGNQEQPSNDMSPHAPSRVRQIQLPLKRLRTGSALIVVDFRLPAGYILNKGAPLSLHWHSSQPRILDLKKADSLLPKHIHFPFIIPFNASTGTAALSLGADVYYCTKNKSLCLEDELQINQPLEVIIHGSDRILLKVPLKQPPPL